MSDSEFNASAQVTQTRAAMGKRLGEIIEAIIGDNRVRELFDKAGKHPDEYAGKPTGLMALDLKVITPETKNALLVAQAAERAFTLAEKAGRIAANHDSLVAGGETISPWISSRTKMPSSNSSAPTATRRCCGSHKARGWRRRCC